jgi:hypothetical protein
VYVFVARTLLAISTLMAVASTIIVLQPLAVMQQVLLDPPGEEAIEVILYGGLIYKVVLLVAISIPMVTKNDSDMVKAIPSIFGAIAGITAASVFPWGAEYSEVFICSAFVACVLCPLGFVVRFLNIGSWFYRAKASNAI